MKPNFALTLSFEGIGLLHRAGPGWHLVGEEVALDSADLTQDMRALRARAIALDPAGLRCKLVIPNDQIRYLSIPDDPGADPEDQARSALDGATPYALPELAFDWSRVNGRIHVAAVARETLAEAEAFATEHDFGPVSFVAIPDSDAYGGEPFFGATAAAAGRFPAGTEIDRDSTPIRIPVRDKAPAPGPIPAPLADAAPRQPRQPKPETARNPSAPAPAAAPAAHLRSGVTAAGAANPALPNVTPPAPPAAFSSIRARRDDNLPDSAPKLDSAKRLRGVDPSGSDPDTAPATRAVVADQAARARASLLPDPDPDTGPGDTSPASTPGPAPAPGPAATFLSRRKARAPEGRADTITTGSKATDTSTQDARTRREDERRRMTVFGARQAPVRGKPRFLGLILMALLLLFLVVVAAWSSIFLDDGLSRLFGTPEQIKVTDVPALSEPDDAIATPAALDAPPEAPTDEALVLLPATPDHAPPPETATDSTGPPPPESAAPVAADNAADTLSSYAASGIWQTAPEPPAMPAGPSDAGKPVQIVPDSDVALQDATTLAAVSPDRTDLPLPTPANPPDPETRFVLDARGLVKPTPEGALTPEGVPVFAGAPPVVPPSAAQRDAGTSEVSQPEETAAPDAPSAETARLASIRPRARPALPEAEAAPATEDADTSGDQPTDTTTDQDDNSETGVLSTGPQVATVRPRLRPEGLVPAASDNGAAAQAASAAGVPVDTDAVSAAVADAAAAATDGARFENATAQAVSASLVPKQRPSDFAAIVEAARESESSAQSSTAQSSTAQSSTAQSSTAQAGSEADDGEPEVTTASLSANLPSSASVAREATQPKAINLREVNLIGVYGTPNNRRALVRLSNGRYVKVKVGDKLDGGQVAAIGDSELRYVKRGQSLLLRMPKG